jgi:Tfp pilus assembly protein PilV
MASSTAPRHRERPLIEPRSAFTLLEVMIALGIFFMAMFAILSLVSTTLRNARALQETEVDAGSLAAQLTLTNKMYEGTYSGDFGDAYPGYSWDRYDTYITNGLWQSDFVVHHRLGRRDVDTTMSIYVFSPDSQPMGGGGFRR